MMTLNDLFAEWFKGDMGAVGFAAQLWDAAQEWDDLHDEGKARNNNTLIAWWAFGKEYDPYFMQWAHILRPIMLNAYLSWLASNELDRGDRNDVAKSYVLRAQIYSVFVAMAWIAGGDAWAAMVGPKIWRAYAETPDELWKEFNNA